MGRSANVLGPVGIGAPDLASPAFKADPFPFYARLRAEAPVWRATLRDRREAWLVTRYEDVARVLKDDTFAKDKLNAMDLGQRTKMPWVPGFIKPLERNMLDLDDPDHTRLRALLEHPEQAERLRRDPSLMKSAVEELLRYTNPVEIATERYTRENAEIGGVTIPRGELVLAVLGSANRDERHFEEPDSLDLARDPNRHLAFGRGGVHHCLGAPLARMEGQIALNALLRRFPGARLAPGTLRWRRGLFLRGLERLPLVL